MEVNELFKHRSITSCMRASYDTITSDFRSLVKQTWTTHVPFAVLLAIVLYFLLPNKPLHDWGSRESDGFVHSANHHLRSHYRDGYRIILASSAKKATVS